MFWKTYITHMYYFIAQTSISTMKNVIDLAFGCPTNISVVLFIQIYFSLFLNLIKKSIEGIFVNIYFFRGYSPRRTARYSFIRVAF